MLVYGMTHDLEFYADRVRLMRVDRASGKHEEWLANWDLTPLHWEFAADGTLVFEAEQNARLKLFTWNGSGEPRALTGDGSASSPTPLAGGRVAFPLPDPVRARRGVTSSAQIGGPASRDHEVHGRGRRQVSHWRSPRNHVRGVPWRGRCRCSSCCRPDFVAGKKYPLVHMIHGGPHGTFGDLWHARWKRAARSPRPAMWWRSSTSRAPRAGARISPSASRASGPRGPSKI
jgi:hypothetical protein